MKKKLFKAAGVEVCDAAAGQVNCAEVSGRIFAAQANNATADRTHT